MSLQLRFLGTGTSAGVPMIGCDCAVCRSDDPRDHRGRPSVMISYPNTDGEGPALRNLLVDATTDLRMAMLAHDVQHLDAVLITHAHADHIFGIDDLRRFNAVMNRPIDVYADAETHDALRRIFRYVFEPHTNRNQSFIPQLTQRLVEPGVPIDLHGARWTPLALMHGRLPILGFRIDLPGGADRPASLAYCTDVSAFPPQTYPLLEELDVLVIDGLRYRHHPTHLTIDQALEQIGQIQPKDAYLTHIAHDILHADLEPRLPPGVHLPYDGLLVTVG